MTLLASRIKSRLKQVWWRVTVIPVVRSIGVDVGAKVRLLGRPIITKSENSSITISARCILCSDSAFTALGINHSVVIRTLRPGAKISIGEDTGISGGSICAAESVKIGKGCLIGANVTITDTDFHAIAPFNRRYNNNINDIQTLPVIIGDNVFVGANSIILKGVKIGKNSIIGAGSVVTRDIGENSIAGGNPARVIGAVPREP